MLYQPKTVAEFTSATKGMDVFYVLLHKEWDFLSRLILKEYEEKFKISKSNFFILDIFEDPEFFTIFHTTSVPALILIDGKESRDQTVPGMIWKTLEKITVN